MEVQATTAIGLCGFDSGRGSDPNAARTEIPTARALVSTKTGPAEPGRSGSISPAAQRYGNAAFITQLIATAQGAPQTRRRRRAEPDVAISVYAAASRSPRNAGHAIRQSQ